MDSPLRLRSRARLKQSVALRLAPLLVLVSVHGTNAQRPTATGSAPVPTVENLQPLWTPAQRLHVAAAPSLIIGTRPDTIYQFGRVAGAVRLRDGSIVVADGEAQVLRFYSSTGIFRSSRGRRGGGPGEFQGLTQLRSVGGDSLVAGSTERLSLFSPSGTFVRRFDPLQPMAPLPDGEKAVLAVLDGGRSIMGSMRAGAAVNRRPKEGVRWTDTIDLALIGANNALQATLGGFPARVMEWQGLDLLLPWFTPMTTSASDGKRFYVGFGNDYAIRVFDSSGRLERIIRRRWVADRVDVEGWVRRWVAAAADSNPAALRSRLLTTPRAPLLPAFQELLVDRAGQLWVRGSRVEDYLPVAGSNARPTTWSVFRADGRWLGDVSMPRGFRPTDIGVDYVLGAAQDEDGVDTVVLYRLGVGR